MTVPPTAGHAPHDPHAPSVPGYPPNLPGRLPSRRGWRTGGFVVGVLLLGIAGLALVDRATAQTTTTHHTYGAAATVELVADGAVTVAAAGTGVEVAATARSGIRSPRYTVDDRSGDDAAGRLVVTNRCRSWPLGFGLLRCSGSLDVTLPAGTRVVVRTTNGAVVATGLAGSVDLRTSNGTIEASGLDGPLTARTSNGRVTVHDLGGDAELRTSNGPIHASGVAGNVDAETSNGRVEVSAVGGDLRASTSNGRVDVAAVEGNAWVRTSNGAVVVRGTGEPVRLTMGTSNGRQTVEGVTDPDATRTVEIRSSNGDVSYLAP
jgi:hypothetical protein